MLKNLKNKLVDALLGTRENVVDDITVKPSYGEGLEQYFKELPQQEYAKNFLANTKMTMPQIQEGIANGLNYGLQGIADKQKELNINIPQTGGEVELARQGQFNQYPLGTSIANNPRTGGILRDMAQGYAENYQQPFEFTNLEPSNKNLATRVGEGLGTVMKAFNSPLGRGAATYLLANHLGYDNPVEEALTGALTRQSRMTEDAVYRNQLGKLGYDEEQLKNIPGILNKDIYNGITSGMRINNQMMTYGQLAMFDPTVAEAVAKNPLLENQFIPITYARDVYGKKAEKAEGEISERAAKTEKLKAEVGKTNAQTQKTLAETGQVGKPKHSYIHYDKDKKENKKGSETIKVLNTANGKTYNVPRADVRKYLAAGGKIVK